VAPPAGNPDRGFSRDRRRNPAEPSLEIGIAKSKLASIERKSFRNFSRPERESFASPTPAAQCIIIDHELKSHLRRSILRFEWK
jgi:hypothetical protein